MTSDGVDRLTLRQRECLRLLYAHHKPGEIATRLGISTDRVNQHLKAARERLGVSRSIDAARILAAAEDNGSAYTPSHNMGDPFVGLALDPDDEQQERASGEEVDHGGAAILREDRAPYFAAHPAGAIELRLPLPTRRQPFNGLTWYQRLGWGIAIALGTTLLAGAMISLQNVVH